MHAVHNVPIVHPRKPADDNLASAPFTRSPDHTHAQATVMQCIYNENAVFDWDSNNLRKIRAHQIKSKEAEEALSNDPIPIYEQDIEGEIRYVYYGETDSGRLLAVILVERGEKIRVVTAYDLDAGQKKEYLARRLRGGEAMKRKPIVMPKFVTQAQEADWWASREGREFLKQKTAGTGSKAGAPRGSRLVGRLNKVSSVQIALRLPEPDVAQARELASRKGIGYQTLIKMLVHEGLRREARRP
jgi:uncharacterized DUF497 family protein